MPIAVTAKKATGGTKPPADGGAKAQAARSGRRARTLPSTAIAGTPLAVTRLHSWWPGTARSRENAKNVREQLVTHAMPQKNWPTHAIAMIASAQFWFISAERKTAIDPPVRGCRSPL